MCMHSNAAIGEDILCFTVNVRLQVLSTKYSLALWYPANHDPVCCFTPRVVMESVAHVVNGCCSYNDLYIARDDHLVDMVSTEVRQVVSPTAHIHKQPLVSRAWIDVGDNVFSCMLNKPDIDFVCVWRWAAHWTATWSRPFLTSCLNTRPPRVISEQHRIPVQACCGEIGKSRSCSQADSTWPSDSRPT